MAKQLLQLLDNIFSEEVVHKNFPVKSKVVMYTCYNKEIHCYMRLLEEIKSTVENLILHIDGKTPRPLDVEKLWFRIQNNQVP